tara:strand:- start:547 stop:1446 length:900 start_codon:yes stop_codon:yes gene_type:complete
MLTKLNRDDGAQTDLEDFPNIKIYICEAYPSYLTQKNYYSAIIAYLETLPRNEERDKVLDNYDMLRMEGNECYNASIETGKLQGKQLENVVSKGAILALMKRLQAELKLKNDKEKAQFLLLLKTYELFPMRNELCTVVLVDVMDYTENKDDKYNVGNWLVKTDNVNSKRNNKIGTPYFKFVFNEYKTAKVLGKREIDLPLGLRKLYDDYLYKYTMYSEGERVFTLKNGSPMDKNNLSKILSRNFKRELDKNISTTILRKIFYGSKYNKVDLENITKDAANAGHSVQTAISIYTTSSIPT